MLNFIFTQGTIFNKNDAVYWGFPFPFICTSKVHLLPRHKKLRKAKMDSAAWARLPFLATRGHSPWARRAVDCGYWLPSGKSVTPLLHWKHRFKVVSLNSPRAELHLLWVLTWTSTGACAPPKQAEDATHCLKQRPLTWRTPGSCTGWLCHTEQSHR